MLENRNPRYDLFAIVLLVIIVFLSASLLSYDPADRVVSADSMLGKYYRADILVWPQNDTPQNACGYWGALTADALLTTLGVGAFFLVIGLGAVAVALLQKQTVTSLWTKTAGWLFSLIGLTTLASLLFTQWSLGPIIGPGGYLGALGSGLLQLHFGNTGSLILAISVLGIGLFMWTEYVIVKLLGMPLVGATTVLAWLLPEFARERVQHWSRAITVRGDADTDEEEFEVDDDEEYEEDERDADDSGLADEASDEDIDDDWLENVGNEQEEEDSGGNGLATIPFVVKTAANSTATKSSVVDEESEDEVEPTVEVDKKSTKGSPFGFGLRKKKQEVPAPKPPSERDQVISQLNRAARIDDAKDYDLPDIKLLKNGKNVPEKALRSQTARRGRLLEQKFLEFGHKVKVVDVETGPVITQYELKLEAGLRLSKIMSLADDIAIGLRVPSVRIVAPIPGKNTVGIEVPNESRQMVRLRDVMEQANQKTRKMKVPLFLGQDVAGDTLVADLSKLPHLLIAGRTGTGKSVCLNAIISSILMTRRPDEVRMLMIDPKMVELSGYGRLPHLMHPVVTDMRKAEAILAWAVDKMEDRYQLLARAGVRHINGYNQLGEEELIERLKPASDEERQDIPVNLPFIVIIADEMADLMMTAGKEVEQHIIRLAQKSRAVGIHLILATQKPTVDVITGLIKSNLPARISFQVASQNDSRVVLDANGAEKLLGNGDMLFLWPGTSSLLRGQGTFLSDDEIDAVTDSVSTGEQNFVNELVNLKVQDPADDELAGKLKSRDELYNDAVEVVIRENRGSVSLLQRALGIGYGRAARLIDFMEEDGIVGPYAGSKSREIIMTMEQWHQLQTNPGNESEDAMTARGNNDDTKGGVATIVLPRRSKSDIQEDDVEESSDPHDAHWHDGYEDDGYEDDEYEDDEYEDDEYEDDEYEDSCDDESNKYKLAVQPPVEEADGELAAEAPDIDIADVEEEEDHVHDEEEEYEYEYEEEEEEEEKEEFEDDAELEDESVADAGETDGDEYEYVYVDEDANLDDDEEWEYEYVDEEEDEEEGN